jgi:hypothetical protein
MERWGPLLDDGASGDGLGLVFPGEQAAFQAASALIDLRQSFGSCQSALGLGTLSYQRAQHLGAPTWHLSGPAKETALELYRTARPRHCLIVEDDYPVLREKVQIQVLGRQFAPKNAKAGGQVLNLLGITAKM